MAYISEEAADRAGRHGAGQNQDDQPCRARRQIMIDAPFDAPHVLLGAIGRARLVSHP